MWPGSVASCTSGLFAQASCQAFFNHHTFNLLGGGAQKSFDAVEVERWADTVAETVSGFWHSCQRDPVSRSLVMCGLSQRWHDALTTNTFIQIMCKQRLSELGNCVEYPLSK